jgi:hypothetical protein
MPQAFAATGNEGARHSMNEVLLCDGLGDAFIGILMSFNGPPLAVYNKKLIISILMKRDEMSYEDASEFFDFNIIGAYVGDRTPVFLEPMSIAEFEEIAGEEE